MRHVHEIIDLPKDIIDAVKEHGRRSNYSDANLMGYIVEYSYKRAHGIPFKVVINTKSDGGVDFVDENGMPWDIKATKSTEAFFNDNGYTVWSVADKAVRCGMNYILCRADMDARKAEICFMLSSDELMHCFSFYQVGDRINEYLTRRPVYSDRRCWVATYSQLSKKAEEDEVDDYAEEAAEHDEAVAAS